MPTNIYGENDNFDIKSSHVIPGLISKFLISKKKMKMLKFGVRVGQSENLCMLMI